MKKYFVCHTSPHRSNLFETMMVHAGKHYFDLFDGIVIVNTWAADEARLSTHPIYPPSHRAPASVTGPLPGTRFDIMRPRNRPYSRAWTKNFAVAEGLPEADDCVIMFNDDDFCFTREGVQFALRYAEERKAASPYWLERIYHTSPNVDGSVTIAPGPDVYDGMPLTGGAFAIRKSTFWRHGGFFEGLVGWGLEDNILEWVLWHEAKVGEICTAPADCAHLRHPRQALEGPGHPFFRLNHSIWRHTVIDPEFYAFTTHFDRLKTRGVWKVDEAGEVLYGGTPDDFAFFESRVKRWEPHKAAAFLCGGGE